MKLLIHKKRVSQNLKWKFIKFYKIPLFTTLFKNLFNDVIVLMKLTILMILLNKISNKVIFNVLMFIKEVNKEVINKWVKIKKLKWKMGKQMRKILVRRPVKIEYR